MVALKNNEILISDVTVVWDGPTPFSVPYNEKLNKYSSPDFIEAVRKIYGDKII